MLKQIYFFFKTYLLYTLLIRKMFRKFQINEIYPITWNKNEKYVIYMKTFKLGFV